MNFIPNTDKDREAMLKEIGVSSVNDLFKDIPSSVFLNESLKIGNPSSEIQLKNRLKDISKKNKNDYISFLGAGAYNHFIPSVVSHIIGRAEFYTAYTPYQPEISQGLLQAIFEFQTMICDLTGMDACNASVYDGATALAESCIMACNITKKNKIMISKSVHPEYKEVAGTYCKAYDILIEEFNGDADVDDDTAAVIVQRPNFFGEIDDLLELKKKINDALLVVCVNEASSLGILKSPGEIGADIVVGEAQSFGNPLNFGGSYVGFMAAKKEYMRHLPGRIVGETVDTEGRKGYILTLQAREQHIRREKASSNICSNQALCALAAGVYLSIVGREGIKELAELNLQKAHYLAGKLEEKGFKVLNRNYYNEFLVKVDDAKMAAARLNNNGILVLDAGEYNDNFKDFLLLCVTEMNTKEEMDKLVELI